MVRGAAIDADDERSGSHAADAEEAAADAVVVEKVAAGR